MKIGSTMIPNLVNIYASMNAKLMNYNYTLKKSVGKTKNLKNVMRFYKKFVFYHLIFILNINIRLRDDKFFHRNLMSHAKY